MIGERIYEAAVRLAVPAVHLAAPFNDRLQRGVRGRAQSLSSLREFAVRGRDASRPLLWLHAPSVGEALMAQAILAAVKESVPEIQSAFTYFSPSAERMAARVGADWSGYLPWDRRGDVRGALAALTPSVIAFVRTEIWPVLVRESERRGIPSVLVNGVLAGDSSRLGRAARALLAPSYGRLLSVGAVSEEDARSFPRLGVASHRIHVTGDARFDQVWQRVARLDRQRPLLRLLARDSRLQLVAGSTWPRDEEILADALSARGLTKRWRAIIAPHEPTPENIAALESRLDARKLRHVRLPQEPASAENAVIAEHAAIAEAADVVIVDRVGVLADIYAAADAAWVGGGFGNAGLHSVVEPAALGVPVMYGRRLGNSREAARLASAGGGFFVGDAAGVADLLVELAGDGGRRRRAGDAARSFVSAHTGGAARSARIVLQALRTGLTV